MPFVNLPTGVYKIRIVDSEPYTKPNSTNKMIRFDCMIAEGEYLGSPVMMFLTHPDVLKDPGVEEKKKTAIKRSWRTFLLSCGVSPTTCDQPFSRIGDQSFRGKSAYIQNIAKNPDETESYDQHNFITPETYTSMLKASTSLQATSPGSQLQLGGTPTGNGTPVLGSMPATPVAPIPGTAIEGGQFML
jgi:hypothetical protein